MPDIHVLDASRLARAKAAYTTRRLPANEAANLISGPNVRPRAGDLVLARVEQIGHHKALETQASRRATLFVGDEVLVCYGDRYAPDQFEAEVCHDLRACDLVAAGGVAACVLSRHDTTRKPTRLQPIGLVGDRAGQPLNLSRFSLPHRPQPKAPVVFAVLGAAMNAGKTTTAASLIHGLSAAGLRVGAAKVTGTGAGGDRWSMVDAGAETVLDFTDAGVPSTYRLPYADVSRVFGTLTAELARTGAEAVVLEVADGVYQRETAWLARSAAFREGVDGVLLAVRDALSAAAGAAWLDEARLPLLALSGAIAQSPLAMQEATEATGFMVHAPDALRDANVSRGLLTMVQGMARRPAPAFAVAA